MKRGHRRLRVVLAGIVVIAVLARASPAPATVQEQRARLPPPAHCEDPVTGTWRSHRYDPNYGDWYIFTLTVRRAPGKEGALIGTVQAHSWNAGPEQEEPPQCSAGINHWTVSMTAEGTHQADGAIEFHGTSWAPENVFCGRGPGLGEYNLDRFTGTIDPSIEEFQSVNNDGGRAVNEPAVFRRIACEDAPPPSPHVQPVAPPFYPERGCGCSVPGATRLWPR